MIITDHKYVTVAGGELWCDAHDSAFPCPVIPCDCTDEYGPCERHGEIVAQREGASLRTADELCEIFLLDVLGIFPDALSPYGQDVLTRVRAALTDAAWLDDDALADELRSVVDQVESSLADLWTYWEDGYRIVRPSRDCPLLDS